MKLIQTKLISATVFGIAAIIIVGCKKEEKTGVKNPDKTVVVSTMGSKAFCNNNNSYANLKARRSNAAKRVALSNTVYNTDFISVGVGGLRDVGTGTISLSGLTGTIKKAVLYWHGVTNSSTDAGNTIEVNGTSVSGTSLGYSSDNCWGFSNSQAYKADITTIVQTTGNGNYVLSSFGSMNPNGASLMVFYDDGDATNNRDVVLFEGNDSNQYFGGITGNTNAPEDPAGWDLTLSGINYSSGTANIQMHVSDGQSFPDGAILLNSTELVGTGPIFSGNSVPSTNNGPTNTGNLWDIRSFDITSFLSVGPNTIQLTSNPYNDCLALVVALVDLPSGAAPRSEVYFDVRPAGCPNPLVFADMGVLPTAILGTADFDVNQIDLSTVKLNGISPVKSSFEDVSSPFTGTVVDCSFCSIAGPDGVADLTLKFDNQAILATLGLVANGQCISLSITGYLKQEFGGGAFTGADKVVVRKK